jgi:predicted ATPase
MHETVTLAQQVAHPFSLCFALGAAALYHQLCREERCTQERAESALSVAQEQGFSYWMAFGAMLYGWALVHQGQAQEWSEQLTQGFRAFQATGVQIWRPYFLALLAEAHGTIGEHETGLAVLTEALALVDTTGVRWYAPELYRLKGELLLAQSPDNHTEAKTFFHHALNIARNQQAKSFELRTVTSLARLWQSQGKRDEARQVLGDVYHWFTEGFDTPDLKDAKALLDELA